MSASSRNVIHTEDEKNTDGDSRLESASTVTEAQRPNRSFKRGFDEAANVLASVTEEVVITPEEDKRILRRIDLYVLPCMLLCYLLQQLDKASVSYTSVFNIVEETHLVGNQYSWLSSVVYVSQLVFQPLSSYALVRLPVGKWVSVSDFHHAAWTTDSDLIAGLL